LSDLTYFPTRRSSDLLSERRILNASTSTLEVVPMSRSAVVILVALTVAAPLSAQRIEHTQVAAHQARYALADDALPGAFAANTLDRKSTRLNSSHGSI